MFASIKFVYFMSSIFHFKQFHVDQQNCAMKINTDGVLLGAVTEFAFPKVILDVGTGTGVIAMMLAQRYPLSDIYGLEIDKSSAECAAYNFSQDLFNNQLVAIEGDLMDYQTELRFDLIVSNPPFFTNSLKNKQKEKSLARHTEWSFFEYLLSFSQKHLNPEGVLQCILPRELADRIISVAHQFGLYLIEEISISSFDSSPIIRKIIGLSNVEKQLRKSKMAIYKCDKVYSEAYISLLTPYFIIF